MFTLTCITFNLYYYCITVLPLPTLCPFPFYWFYPYWLYILISITLWPFNWYQTLLILWLRTSYRPGYIYIYIYGKEKKLIYTHYFWITKLQTFKKNSFYCSKHLPSIAYIYSQKYFIFTKFFRKRKYYRELISYEQCRLARIISKSGWVVVS